MAKYKGKKALVVGLGSSGAAAARYLHDQGAEVVITDIRPKADVEEFYAKVQDLRVEFDLGKHTAKYFHESDLIIVSPGVPFTLKQLEEARERNIQIMSEVDLAASALKEPLIAITGTNGKTTTTLLVGEMLRAGGKKVFVGGNVGTPLIEYFNRGEKADVVVAEVSSFQLELTDRMVPAVAIFTNLGQDHMDRYPDMATYIDAKKRLLRLCDRNSYVVLNYDDSLISQFAQENPGRLMWFTKRNPMKVGGEFAEQFCGSYFIPGSYRLTVKVTGQEETYDLSRLRLFGDHNKENLMAAICAARSMGVDPAAIQQVINSFPGVEHRLEFVRKKNGVYFINDSKSTNVMSLYRSLMAFRRNPIILIAGGKDKDLDFSPLGEAVQNRVKTMILIGESKERMNRTLGDYAETFLVGTFEEAILMAYQKSRTGDIILLSPGCASQDMFRNFEARGEYFKKLVHQL
jgi:UDP-N-acetylmuramoylalanine--D-glutamate ligase